MPRRRGCPSRASPSDTRNSSQTHSGSSNSVASTRSSACADRQDITGYHYWLIVDFPGGTGEGDSWEEGWFDYFWRPKGITPRDGQAINSAVLPLITSGVSERTRWSDDGAPVEICRLELWRTGSA